MRGGRIPLILLCLAAVGLWAETGRAQPGGVDAVERSSLPLGGVPDAAAGGEGLRGGASESGGRAGGLARAVWPLAVVVSLIGVLAWGGRAYAKSRGGLMLSMTAGGRAPAGILTVLGRYPIGRGQTLVLLRCDTRVLLLHQTGGSKGEASTLAEFKDPEEVASLVRKADTEDGTGPGARFASMLGVARGTLETKPEAEANPGPTPRVDGSDAAVGAGWSYRRLIRGDGDDRAELLGGAIETEGAEREPGLEVEGVEDLASRLEALRRGATGGAGVGA